MAPSQGHGPPPELTAPSQGHGPPPEALAGFHVLITSAQAHLRLQLSLSPKESGFCDFKQYSVGGVGAFPGGPGAKPALSIGGPGFGPCSGNWIPHAATKDLQSYNQDQHSLNTQIFQNDTGWDCFHQPD